MNHTSDLTALLAQFAPACHKAAHKYSRLASVRALYDHDDLFSIAQAAVVKAAQGWDESKGTKLSSYIISMISWELGHVIRKPVTQAQQVQMHSITVTEEERGDEWHPMVEDVPDNSMEILFDTVTAGLDERSVNIVRLRLVDGLTFEKMGEALDCSGVHARNLFENAMISVRSKAEAL